MIHAKNNWTLAQPDAEKVASLKGILGDHYSDAFLKLLAQKDFASQGELEEFLTDQPSLFHDPYAIYDMDRAIERLQEAIMSGQKIVIYGDYDADGITSTTILYETLLMIGAEVDYYLPNRFKDGYGPNIDRYQELIDQGANLILTCDNGVMGHEAIDYAQSRGVDVIVTDHHDLPENLPEAYAVVHPRHPKGTYPFGELAGVGVAFKVAAALLEEVPNQSLDLVAIGTIADLVSLTDENRTLVRAGLEQLKETERIGLHMLMEACQVDRASIDADTVGFTIAPHLNALGRIADPSIGVQLLMTDDPTLAEQLVKQIQATNQERKDLVQSHKEAVMARIDTSHLPAMVIESDATWHEGISGIVASHVVQETGRPAIIFVYDTEAGVYKGSGRSVPGFNLFEAISGAAEGLTKYFGGHDMACGLTVEEGNYQAFIQAMEAYTASHNLGQAPELDVHLSLPISQVTKDLIKEIDKLAPFGTGNPKLIIYIENTQLDQARGVGQNGAHLKFSLKDQNQKLDGIGFGFGKLADQLHPGQNLEVVGALSLNEWNGIQKPQMMLEDLRVTDRQFYDQRGSQLPEQTLNLDQALWLVFDPINEKKISPLLGSKADLIMYNKIDEVDTNLYNHLVVYDCPPSLDIFRQLLTNTEIGSVHLHFASRQQAYMVGMPQKQEFTMIYKYFASHPNLPIKSGFKEIQQYLKIDGRKLIFVIEVFTELNFILIEDGILNMVANPEKRQINETKAYRNRLDTIEAERVLLYSSFNDLISWINKTTEN